MYVCVWRRSQEKKIKVQAPVSSLCISRSSFSFSHTTSFSSSFLFPSTTRTSPSHSQLPHNAPRRLLWRIPWTGESTCTLMLIFILDPGEPHAQQPRLSLLSLSHLFLRLSSFSTSLPFSRSSTRTALSPQSSSGPSLSSCSPSWVSSSICKRLGPFFLSQRIMHAWRSLVDVRN